MLSLYRAAVSALAPAVRWHLARRAAAGKEDPARLPERLGHPSLPRPSGPLAWIHAASVGEARSVLPLIGRLRDERPGLAVLVTTGTVTAAAVMRKELPDWALHQFAPVDLPQVVARFLDHWRPDLVLLVESELWPSLLDAVASRGTSLVLLNGRMSLRSYRRWRRAPTAAAALLGRFAVCLAQSPADAERLTALGAPNVAAVGNIKFAAPPLPADDVELAQLAAAAAGRPCWVAASTHPGEDEVIIAVHLRVRNRLPSLLTLLVPRHPERGEQIAGLLRAAGLPAARRRDGAPLTADCGIYLADTIGELGLWYRLAAAAFIGGSLVPRGGQNPLEAARLDCAILHGPFMSNFAAIAGEMLAAGASRQVDDGGSLAAALETLLADEAACRECRQAAAAYAAGQAGVLDRVVAAIRPLLPAAAQDEARLRPD